MAAESGVAVDEPEFRRLMNEQRTRAKADAQSKKTAHVDLSVYRSALENGSSHFTGYSELVHETTVTSILGGQAGSSGLLAAAVEGDEVELVLAVTPFYAEGGGQLADTGVIRTGSGGHDAVLTVLDVQQPVPGVIAHRVRVETGEVRPGDFAFAEVDPERRVSVSRSHSATHLLHTALKRALGESAAQAGSLNAPGRLRFDFTTPGAVPASVLTDIEEEINDVLLHDLPVSWFVTSQDEALRLGAIAMFGEKYGDAVRVVEIGDYSRELCGGTHVSNSSVIGMVKLLGEASSIGSGVRRVDALVGLDAFRFLAREHVLVNQLAAEFKSPPDELPERIAGVLDKLKAAEKELGRLRSLQVLAGAGELAGRAETVGATQLIALQAPDGLSGADLRTLAMDVRGRLDAGRAAVVVLISDVDGAAHFVAAVNPVGQQDGPGAGDLVKIFAPILGARGGGKADLAQGAGGDVSAVPAALAAVRGALVGP